RQGAVVEHEADVAQRAVVEIDGEARAEIEGRRGGRVTDLQVAQLTGSALVEGDQAADVVGSAGGTNAGGAVGGDVRRGPGADAVGSGRLAVGAAAADGEGQRAGVGDTVAEEDVAQQGGAAVLVQRDACGRAGGGQVENVGRAEGVVAVEDDIAGA